MDLHSWVSDNVIQFLGAAHSTVVDYIIAEAQSAKSPEALYNKLSDVGFSSAEGKEFAENLFVKVPRQRKHTLTTEKKSKQSSAALLQQSSSYKLLLEPEETTGVVELKERKEKDKKDKKDRKSKIRRREDVDAQWESDEEEKRERKRLRQEYEDEQR